KPLRRPTLLRYVTGTSVRDAASGESASSRRPHERLRPQEGCWAEGVPAFSAKLTCQSQPEVCVRAEVRNAFFSRIACRSGVLSTADAFPSDGGREHPHLHSHVPLERSAEPAEVGDVEVTWHHGQDRLRPALPRRATVRRSSSDVR